MPAHDRKDMSNHLPIMMQSPGGTILQAATNLPEGFPIPVHHPPQLVVGAAPHPISQEPKTIDKNMDNTSMRGIFDWVTIDGVKIPYLFRDNKMYVAVRMVEMKLLSKYPSCYPEELKNRAPLMSHYITGSEAKLLNRINMDHCNHEYGKQKFSCQDLIVKLTDFNDFLSIVKKHFPSQASPTDAMTKSVATGGWIRVNNTVIPYVIRDKTKYLPLSVLRYAAGLLTEEAIEGFLPTDEECEFLNSRCREAGLRFSFSKKARLVVLDVLRKQLHYPPLLIQELKSGRPFDEAEYQEIPGSPMYGSFAGATVAPPLPNQPTMRPPPPYPAHFTPNMEGIPTAQQQVYGGYWMNPHVGIFPGAPNNQAKTASVQALKQSPGLQFVNMSGGISVPQQASPAARQAAENKSDAEVNNNNQDLRALARLSQMASPLESVEKLSGTTAIRSPVGQMSPYQAQAMKGEWKPMVVATEQVRPSKPRASQPGKAQPLPQPTYQPLPRYKESQSEKGASPANVKINPVQFQGKTISCLIRNGTPFALVEAAGRVYFPKVVLPEFIRVLEDVLHISISELQPQEEKAFINFYDLPIDHLMCNKIISLADLEHNLPQLVYMFVDKNKIEGGKESEEGASNSHATQAAVSAQNQTHAVLREHLGVSRKRPVRDPASSIQASKMKKGLEAAVARLKQQSQIKKKKRKTSQESNADEEARGSSRGTSPAVSEDSTSHVSQESRSMSVTSQNHQDTEAQSATGQVNDTEQGNDTDQPMDVSTNSTIEENTSVEESTDIATTETSRGEEGHQGADVAPNTEQQEEEGVEEGKTVELSIPDDLSESEQTQDESLGDEQHETTAKETESQDEQVQEKTPLEKSDSDDILSEQLDVPLKEGQEAPIQAEKDTDIAVNVQNQKEPLDAQDEVFQETLNGTTSDETMVDESTPKIALVESLANGQDASPEPEAVNESPSDQPTSQEVVEEKAQLEPSSEFNVEQGIPNGSTPDILASETTTLEESASNEPAPTEPAVDEPTLEENPSDEASVKEPNSETVSQKEAIITEQNETNHEQVSESEEPNVPIESPPTTVPSESQVAESTMETNVIHDAVGENPVQESLPEEDDDDMNPEEDTSMVTGPEITLTIPMETEDCEDEGQEEA